MSEYGNTVNNGTLGWDSTVEEDGNEFILLPEGIYVFKVYQFERGTFPGSTKIPPCDKATVELEVTLDDGRISYVKTDFILHSSLEWKLSSFFRCIGLKKHGKPMTMEIGPAFKKAMDEGMTGRAKIKTRSYTDKDGNKRQVNDIEMFIDADEEKETLNGHTTAKSARTAAKPVTKEAETAIPKEPVMTDEEDDLLGD